MAVNRISELDALPLHDDIIVKDTTKNVERLNDKFRKSWFEISYFNKEDNELPSYYLSRKLYIEDVLSAASNYFISVLSDPTTILSNLKVFNLSAWGEINLGKPDYENGLMRNNSVFNLGNFYADKDTVVKIYGETRMYNRLTQRGSTFFDSCVLFRKDPDPINHSNPDEYRTGLGPPTYRNKPGDPCAVFFGDVKFYRPYDVDRDGNHVKQGITPAIWYKAYETSPYHANIDTDSSDNKNAGVLHVQNVIVGCSSSALWADLAENYEADAKYEPGTLIQFGGEKEITIATTDVNAVVSSNPAYVMNHKENENYLPIALTGRVPVKVIGKINKFDNIVLSGIPGIAKAQEDVTEIVIGKALTTNDSSEIKLVECVIKLTL